MIPRVFLACLFFRHFIDAYVPLYYLETPFVLTNYCIDDDESDLYTA